MNGSRHNLFAGAAFAGNQHRSSIAAGHTGHQVKYLAHTFAMPDNIGKMVVIAALTSQLTQFTVHGACLQGPLHHHQQLIKVKTLQKIVRGAQLHGSNGSLYIAMCSEHHYW